jgi:hypothetical protein
MKRAIFNLALVVSTAAAAQSDTAAVPVDLHLAGYYQERAAELRQDRNLLVGAFLTYGVIELVRKNSVPEYGWTLVGVAAGFHFGLEIPINRNERRAARVLQGLKP